MILKISLHSFFISLTLLPSEPGSLFVHYFTSVRHRSLPSRFVRLRLPPSDSVFLVRTSQLCASCNMEIINNSPETSDYEEEDNVSQARDREVPLQNAELSEEVASKAKKKTKHESVQALLCARSWLYGFQELDDVDNIDKDDETHGSVQESNSVEYVNID
ncbi:hypothetical protein P8452_37856 [Trifolium repens]|nr:hypothetical protein P8452_37856 [Trifolium repens]